VNTALPPAPEFGAALPVEPSAETLRFLALRRSTSALTLEAPAPSRAQLADLIRIAARTPDHGKLTPWRFIVLDAEDKAVFAARLEAIASARDDKLLVAKLGKLKIPPLAVVVVSSPRSGAIPEWEQILSAGAVCTHLLDAALAMGFGANWITDWYSYDAQALEILGLGQGEKVAGLVLLGAASEPPLERERPDVTPLTTRWRG